MWPLSRIATLINLVFSAQRCVKGKCHRSFTEGQDTVRPEGRSFLGTPSHSRSALGPVAASAPLIYQACLCSLTFSSSLPILTLFYQTCPFSLPNPRSNHYHNARSIISLQARKLAHPWKSIAAAADVGPAYNYSLLLKTRN